MARKSVKLAAAPTKSEAQEIVKAHSKAVHARRSLQTKLDAELDKVRKKYTEDLAALDAEIQASFDRIRAFAEEYRDEEFGAKKSQDWSVAVVGFRLGQPTTKARKGFTWAAVLNLLKDRNLTRFIRLKEEPNKESMLEVREDVEIVAQLRDCGVEFEQAETFYIDVKTEEAILA